MRQVSTFGLHQNWRWHEMQHTLTNKTSNTTIDWSTWKIELARPQRILNASWVRTHHTKIFHVKSQPKKLMSIFPPIMKQSPSICSKAWRRQSLHKLRHNQDKHKDITSILNQYPCSNFEMEQIKIEVNFLGQWYPLGLKFRSTEPNPSLAVAESESVDSAKSTN